MTKDDRYAFLFIYDDKCGKFSDLVHYIGEDNVEKFCSVGFIKTGYTADYKTWGITELGKQYIEDFIL